MEQNIEFFAEKIKVGELVAFPTETVYGLGANAFDPTAVAKIFTAKGRPADNPLIVHVATIEQISEVAENISPVAKELFEKFSPGPLTVLLPKRSSIPDIVTANSSLVGVRIPNHELALLLLKAAGVPIAAPSANKSGKPSATHHNHVRESFGDEVPNVIEGGDTTLGVESTVVLPTENKITILRQGAITQEELQVAFPNIEIVLAQKDDLENAPSPGIKYRHYAPKGEVTVLPLGVKREEIESLCASLKESILLCSQELHDILPSDIQTIVLGSEKDLLTVAKNLYGALLECDRRKIARIFVQSYPEVGIGRTIMERIHRAAETSNY